MLAVAVRAVKVPDETMMTAMEDKRTANKETGTSERKEHKETEEGTK